MENEDKVFMIVVLIILGLQNLGVDGQIVGGLAIGFAILIVLSLIIKEIVSKIK